MEAQNEEDDEDEREDEDIYTEQENERTTTDAPIGILLSDEVVQQPLGHAVALSAIHVEEDGRKHATRSQLQHNREQLQRHIDGTQMTQCATRNGTCTKPHTATRQLT
jgi:hypothetical protein